MFKKNKIVFIAATCLTAFSFGCQMPATSNVSVNSNASNVNATANLNANKDASQESNRKTYKIGLTATPEKIEAGKPAKLAFTVRDNAGSVIKDLQIVHEKPMHLLIVSEDLAFFDHQHPEVQSDGSYSFDYTFKNGGNYRLYADVTPKDSTQYVENLTVNVQGAPRPASEIKADGVTEKSVDGIKVKMSSGGEIRSGKEMMLDFVVNDAKTGKAVTNLENYLGELAHFVIISRDLKNFVHAHPMSKKEHSARNGSAADEKAAHNADGHQHGANSASANQPGNNVVSAHVSFPTAGLYKLWAQFKRNGKVITVPFIVDVKDGGNGEKTAELARPQNGLMRVIVNKEGFTPSNIALKQGEKLKMTFLRTDSENCGNEVVFPSLGIKKELPVGRPVEIEVAGGEAGEISFACGMNMYKGKIVVQ